MHLLIDAVSNTGSIGGWRGQPAIGMRIDSSLLRRIHRFGPIGEAHEEDIVLPPSLDDLEESSYSTASAFLERQVSVAEGQLLQKARLIGHAFLEGRELTDLELLAIFQHHGAATRLLDLSRNVFSRIRVSRWGSLMLAGPDSM
jgi:hypothetical protein